MGKSSNITSFATHTQMELRCTLQKFASNARARVCVHVDKQNGKLKEDIRLKKKTMKFHFISIVDAIDAQRSAQTKSYLHSIANKLQRICLYCCFFLDFFFFPRYSRFVSIIWCLFLFFFLLQFVNSIGVELHQFFFSFSFWSQQLCVTMRENRCDYIF